jgi:hypothetical protein
MFIIILIKLSLFIIRTQELISTALVIMCLDCALSPSNASYGMKAEQNIPGMFV